MNVDVRWHVRANAGMLPDYIFANTARGSVTEVM
jgi:hypothetical protein